MVLTPLINLLVAILVPVVAGSRGGADVPGQRHRGVLTVAFQGIGAVISWVWTYGIKPAFEMFAFYLRLIGAGATWLWQNKIQRPGTRSNKSCTRVDVHQEHVFVPFNNFIRTPW